MLWKYVDLLGRAAWHRFLSSLWDLSWRGLGASSLSGFKPEQLHLTIQFLCDFYLVSKVNWLYFGASKPMSLRKPFLFRNYLRYEFLVIESFLTWTGTPDMLGWSNFFYFKHINYTILFIDEYLFKKLIIPNMTL